MLAMTLCIGLLLEFAGYAVAARYFLDLAPGMASLAALAIMLGLRAGIIAVTWAHAFIHLSPAAPLGVARALAMIVAEYLAFLALFLVIQPFERAWMGKDRLLAGRRVVLLVHGYACNRGAWWWLRRRLEDGGYTVATLNLEPIYADIDRYVSRLAERIETVCRETGCARLALVGHSMGGLVARAYLATAGADRVERLVTIATPHAGTMLAPLGIGTNARQMEAGSAWLRKRWRESPPVPATAMRASHDNFVMPQDNQRLPGAVDVELPAVGHLALLFSGKTADALLERLSGGQ